MGDYPDRFEFLLALRADLPADHRQIDQKILRDVVHDLEAYVTAWNNQLQRVYMRDRRELIAAHDRAARRLAAPALTQALRDAELQESLDSARIKPRDVPLSAIREIALAVTSQKDSRHPLLRRLLPFNPVAARHRELRQRYRSFVERPDAARTEMERAVDQHQLPAKLADTYDLLEQAANDILQREVLLRDLAAAGRSLADSAEMPALLEHRGRPRHSLTPKRIRTLSRFFAKQADIEGIRFETLHLASQRFYRLQYPAQRTERLHREAIREFQRIGYSRFDRHVTLSRPII